MDSVVHDGVIGVIRRIEELFHGSDDAICTALALFAASLEAELKARLPMDRPDLVRNTRSLIEGLADRATKEIEKRRMHLLYPPSSGSLPLDNQAPAPPEKET